MKILTIIIGLGSASILYASQTTTVNENQTISNPPLQTHSTSVHIENLENNSLKLSQTDITHAKAWGLSNEEWSRYLTLKSQERSIWSPNLDPLSTLGIEAKTESERKKYASLLAKKEYERVEKELAFQRAYDEAFKALYPGQLPFSNDEYLSMQSPNGAIYYFTQLENCPACAQSDQKILQYANAGTQIHIYFVGEKSDNAIQNWARKLKISPEKVKNKDITLNYDKGFWARYAKNQIPVAFKKGVQEWEKVSY